MSRVRALRRDLLLCCLAWAPGCALAQRADQNAVTEATDAFGSSNGFQSVGLYTIEHTRGFNPQQAGNLRIEGLYFDFPNSYVSPCLMRSTTIRVGIGAQSYDFPAPTGIVDIALPRPEGSGASLVLDGGSYGQLGGLLEGRATLGRGLAAGVCVTVHRGFDAEIARRSADVGSAAMLRFAPRSDLELRLFAARDQGGEHGMYPVVYTDEIVPPPAFVPHRLGAQDYTSIGWRSSALGALLNWTPDPRWALSAGLFQAWEQDPRNFIDEYLSILTDGSAWHELDVVPRTDARSTSGQWRVARLFGAGVHTRALELMMRGRVARRDFGGDALVEYGPVGIHVPLQTDLRPFAPAPVSADEVHQLDAGVMYEERWRGVGSLSLGLLHGQYRRTLRYPDLPGSRESASPWLPNLRFTAQLAASTTLYGSLIQGLEDSALAPSSAVNRGEPPPATRSRQVDFGVRVGGGAGWSVLLGVFEIRKPYFNLGVGHRYEQLGALRYRGLESSVDASCHGITVVAGAVWLRPHVTRTRLEPDATGTVPIGPVPLTLDFNLDIAPPELRPFAASLLVSRISARAVTADDQHFLPALTTVGAGVRYETRWRGHALTVRLDGENLGDSQGLHVSGVGQLFVEPPRRLELRVAADL